MGNGNWNHGVMLYMSINKLVVYEISFIILIPTYILYRVSCDLNAKPCF
jgi:hypothetical protein